MKLPCNPKAKIGGKFGAVYNPACGIPGEKRVKSLITASAQPVMSLS